MSTKKKNLRFRPIAILLMASVIALSAASAFGANITIGDFTYSYNLSTKEGSIEKYNGSAESVAIPSSFSVPETYRDNDGETRTRYHAISVTSVGGFSGNTTIKHIVFPDKLMVVRTGAFYNCWNLTGDIDLSKVTSIGNYAFQSTSITSVRTSDVLTSIGWQAFWQCRNMESAEINGTKLDLSGASMLFEDCTNLRHVTLGDGIVKLPNAQGVYWLSGVFHNCTNLQSVVVGNGLAEVPSSLFARCGNSKDKLSVSFAAPITSIGRGAFNNGNIANISIDLSQVVTIAEYAFDGCGNLRGDIVLPSVTSIGNYAFEGTGITSVWTSAALTYLGQYVFAWCGGLREAEINGTNLNLGSSYDLFHDCQKLRKVKFGDGVTKLCEGNGIYGTSRVFINCTNLQSVVVGNGVTEVPSYLFSRCGNSKDKLSVSFAAPLSSIGSGAFSNGNITNLDLRLSQCGVAGYAFSGCQAVMFDSDNFSRIASIGQYAFENCGNIVGDLDLSLIKSIGQYAFRNCGRISSVKFGSTLTSIGYNAFSGCANASSFAFASAPPSVGSSPFSNVKSGAVGTYTAAHAAEWEAVIDSRGYWNGLKMKPSYYTVIYDANNGTGARTTATVEWGEPTPAGDGTFTWEAHYFMGWAFEDVGGSTLGSDDVIPEPQEGNTVTLYGQWATFEPVAANWGTGSITLKATGVSLKEGEEFFLSYCDASAAESDSAHWDYVEDLNKTTDGTGVSFTDTQFYSRLGGIPTVRYRLQIGKSKEDVRATMCCTTRNRYGIFVGVGHYSEEYQKKCMWYGGGEPLDDLPEVEDNTRRYAELSRDNGAFTFTVSPLIGTSATTESVDAAFVTTAETVSPGDVCLFYVATHGGVLSKDNGGLEKGTAVLALYDDDYSEFRLKDGIDLLSARNAAVICILSACRSEALVRQSSANVAVIAAANYQGFSTELFDEIFMEYGWRNGWARNDDALTFGDLAAYVKARYNAIFNGITFDDEGELTTRSVQVDNDDLLSKVLVGRCGVHENKKAPVAPTGFVATQASYNDKIRVSWNESTDADLYFVFYGGRACSVYAGYRDTKSASMWFDDDFVCVKASSPKSPVPFEIRAFNGAGVSPSAVTEGWINTRRIVTFDAKGGELGIWQGIVPVEGKLFVPYEKGSELGMLPMPIRNGFTYVCWYTEKGSMTTVATVDTEIDENVTYYARWTDMTTEYLSTYPKIAAASGNNIATAAAMTAANGCRTVGECYALGIDPEDPNDDLKISDFKMEDGKPMITLNHTKDGSGNSFEQRIKTLGKASLTDAEWREVPENGDATMRFFKVMVEMP